MIRCEAMAARPLGLAGIEPTVLRIMRRIRPMNKTRADWSLAVAEIHILEARHDEARLGKVSNGIQQPLTTELGILPDDFFQILHFLRPSQFRHTRRLRIIDSERATRSSNYE